LGVLLYELLTGTTPLERKRFAKAAHDEIRRLIREEEPPKPSMRLSSSDSIASIAAQRHTEPAKLSKLVRGDLDWITMKCLEKDRTRRYETANGLARDIQRYLADEPVEASPPSATYRLKKFAKKNRAALTTAAAIALLLVAGTTISTWQAIRATRAERDAQASRQEADGQRQAAEQAAAAEKAANEQAQKRLAQIEKGNEIITAIFTDLDIRAVKKGTEPLEAVLAKRLVHAADQLEGEAVGHPLVVAGLQDRLGQSLLSLGHSQAAIPLFVKARKTRTSELGADHPDTLTTMSNLASGYHDAGNLNLAMPLYEETLKFRIAKLGPDNRDTLTSMHKLAFGYRASGKVELAVPLYEKTLMLRKANLGADHVDTLATMNNLAEAYRAARKLDLALPLWNETLRLRKAKLGADHADTLTSMNNLAGGYAATGRLDLALALLDETLRLRKAKLGADHPDTLTTMNNLAYYYQEDGRLDLALPLFQEAAAAIENRRFQHEYAHLIIPNLCDCHEQLKQFVDAESWRRKWVIVVKERKGANSAPYAAELAGLGLNLILQQKWTEAETVLKECLAIRQLEQPDAWTTFNTQSLIGAALMGQKKFADAEHHLLKGYEGMKAREKTIPPQTSIRIPEAINRLIKLYTATNKPDEVKKWQAERAEYPPAK
jgi:hypothetical protein